MLVIKSPERFVTFREIPTGGYFLIGESYLYRKVAHGYVAEGEAATSGEFTSFNAILVEFKGTAFSHVRTDSKHQLRFVDSDMKVIAVKTVEVQAFI